MPQAGSWAVEGIGEDFIPPNCDLSLVSKAYAIPDPDSFAASRELAARGRHSGGLILRHAARGGAALLPRAERARSGW